MKRRLSTTEQLYVAMQEEYKTLSIQLVVKGDGEIDRERFKKAVEESIKYTPFITSILDGRYWKVTGKMPEIIYMGKFDETLQDGIFKMKHNLKKDGVAKIYVYKDRYLFNVFHGVMDGKGVGLWVRNIFRALNGESLIKENIQINDEEFLSNISKKVRRKKLKLDIKQRKLRKGDNNFKRITLPGVDRNIIYILGKTISEFLGNDNERFMIPTDIRKYDENIVSSSNMVLPIFLDIKRGESIKDIRSRFMKKFREKDELMCPNAKNMGLKFGMEKCFIKGLDKIHRLTNRWFATGIISNVGLQRLEDYSTDSFKATSIYSIPSVQPFLPLVSTIIENENTTEVTLGCYENYLTKEELDELGERFRNNFLKENQIFIFEGDKVEIAEEERYLNKVYDNLINLKENIAVYENGKEYSYGDLKNKIEEVISILKEKEFKVGDKVFIHQKRSFNFLASILAVFFIGGIAIPIDLKDTKKSEKILNSTIGIYLGEEDLLKNLKNKEELEIISGEKRGYIIYTSGTTSEPKGIEILKSGMDNHFFWGKNYFNIKKEDRFSFFTSIGVDLTMSSYLLPLYAGASIEVYDEEVNIEILRELIENPKITFIKLTPTHVKLLNKIDIKTDIDKNFIVGGEELKSYDVKKLLEKVGKNSVVYNEYGPAESTVAIMVRKVERGDIYLEREDIPLGRPIYNTKIIIKKNKLYVQGIQLGKGYVDGEKRGFTNIGGERGYDTNDIVKIDENGEIIFLNRVGNEIKNRGFLINKKEIEDSIKEFLPSVENIIITSKDGILECYLVSQDKIDRDKLSSYLKSKLSPQSIPNRIYINKELKVLSGGKIDLKNMRDNFKELEQIELEYRNEKEKKIIDIFEDILEIKLKDIDRSFFELGGDSVGYISLQNELIRNFKISREKEDIFLNMLNIFYDDLTVENLMKIVEGIE